MSKLKSKSDVIEWYWPDFLRYCMLSRDNGFPVNPTQDNFWKWYINDGPMGLKHQSLLYTKEDVEYV